VFLGQAAVVKVEEPAVYEGGKRGTCPVGKEAKSYLKRVIVVILGEDGGKGGGDVHEGDVDDRVIKQKESDLLFKNDVDDMQRIGDLGLPFKGQSGLGHALLFARGCPVKCVTTCF